MREGRATTESSEQVGTTETTGAKLDEQRAADQNKAKANEDQVRKDALEEGKRQGMAEAKAECDKEHADKKAKTEEQKKAKPATTAKKGKAKETSMTKPSEPTSTTTITSAPAMSPEPREEPNQSTTLGNGQSGMYTGGAGTYGGTATWGSGTKK
jgi:membrane protein involved in colicin uptake